MRTQTQLVNAIMDETGVTRGVETRRAGSNMDFIGFLTASATSPHQLQHSHYLGHLTDDQP